MVFRTFRLSDFQLQTSDFRLPASSFCLSVSDFAITSFGRIFDGQEEQLKS